MRLFMAQLEFHADTSGEIDSFIERSLIMNLDDSTYASEVAQFDLSLG